MKSKSDETTNTEDALKNMAVYVLENEDGLRDSLEGNPFIHPDAWLKAARYVLDAINTRDGK